MTSEASPLIAQARKLHADGNMRSAAEACGAVLKTEPDNVEALHLMGVALADAGLYGRAIPFLQKALLIGGPNSGVLFTYGVALFEEGRTLEAVRAFKNAADAAPERADCWFRYGEASWRLDRLEAAQKGFENAASLDAENAGYREALARFRLDTGDITGTIESYENILTRSPENIQPANNLAVAYRRAGRLDDGIALLEKYCRSHPREPSLFGNLGNLYADAGRSEAAIGAYLDAIKLAPHYGDAHYNLGCLYLNDGRYQQAAISLRTALSVDPAHRNAKLKLGQVLQQMGELGEAARELSRLMEQHPNDPAVLTGYANILRDQGKFDQCHAIFRTAAALAPGDAAVLGNAALAVHQEGRLEEAVQGYHRALAIEPDNPWLAGNLAQALLLAGRFEEGWAAFETRLKEPDLEKLMSGLPGENWTGQPLDGKSILVQAEQGLGDTIQFLRYLPHLEERGARVVLSAPERLHRLLRGGDGIAELGIAGKAPSGIDFHVPLMSLPHRAGLAAVPAPARYLTAEPERLARWRQKLPEDVRIKIGIAWQGNRRYALDYARSIPLKTLLPAFEGQDVQLVSLQAGQARAQLAGAARPVTDFGDDLDRDAAFVDTAAVMSCLDLVVTSDTAIPHLAGALGVPTWVLLPFAPDWRWQLGRSDSPWYPSVRLIRQSRQGDWESAIGDARKRLAAWIASGGEPNQSFNQN